jgi:hypothetical protein
MNGKTTKVFWNLQEKRQLCQASALLMLDLQASSKLDALHQAQQAVLPPERHRDLKTLQGCEWFLDGVEQEIDRLRLERKARPPENSAVLASLDDMSLAQLWPLLRKRLVTEAASFLSDVLKEVKWPEQVTPEIAEATMDAVVSRVRHLPFLVSDAPKSAKPSALIVGLRGGQLEEIRRDFGEQFDLRFFTVDENKDKLRHMCEQVDHAIAVTDFISHSHEDIMKSRSRHYVRSNGGITRLKEVLKGLLGAARLPAAA